MACFMLFALFMALVDEAHIGWVIADCVCVVYWLCLARKAVKQGKPEVETVESCQEAIALLKDMSRAMGKLIAKKEMRLLELEKEAEEVQDG